MHATTDINKYLFLKEGDSVCAWHSLHLSFQHFHWAKSNYKVLLGLYMFYFLTKFYSRMNYMTDNIILLPLRKWELSCYIWKRNTMKRNSSIEIITTFDTAWLVEWAGGDWAFKLHGIFAICKLHCTTQPSFRGINRVRLKREKQKYAIPGQNLN